MQLRIQQFELELNKPFNITHSSRKHQKTLILSLEKEGTTGLGEAAAVSYYGLEAEQMKAEIERLSPELISLPMNSPEEYWSLAFPILKHHPFLLCALDVAVHDWFAKRRQVPLYQFWGLELKNIPYTSYTIGIDEIPVMIDKLKEKPWPIYKIKLGRENDLEIIKALRQHTDSIFRVDANTGWTVEQALDLIPQLKELGVDMIEQPLKTDNWEGMKILKDASPLPLIADESCQIEKDVERCHTFFHGINIKLMKCGGLTPALRMIKKARALNLEVMLGCMIESSVGNSAEAHLLPLIDYADIDSPLLIKNDPANGVNWKNGQAIYKDRPGTGAEFNKR